MTIHSGRLRRPRRLATLVAFLFCLTSALAMTSAYAVSYPRLSGGGSSWAGNAINQWKADVAQQGTTVDYEDNGSSIGRKNFATNLSDFAVSEIPYTGDTASGEDTDKPAFSYASLPVVAGGTAFAYNLPVNGTGYTQLKLSQAALAKIFSGQVTDWSDPVIAATNPGVNLPVHPITVVVRNDGSGATAQFLLWMLRQFPADFAALCAKTGCNPGAATSYYPTQGLANFTSANKSAGVTQYVGDNEYSINYDEYAYAQGAQLPVAQVQNQAGFFTTPTDTAVAVALTQAQINGDVTSVNYLSQDLSRVYAYGDPRTYPISAYSYLFVATEPTPRVPAEKGATLAYFATYSLCEGQRSMGALGYSPLPMNLVLAAMDQVSKIPGIDGPTSALIAATRTGAAAKAGGSNPCNNPTFRPGDDPAHNVLVDTAPFPDGCDAPCQAPWRLASAGTNAGVGGKVKASATNSKKNGAGGAGGVLVVTGGAEAATGTDPAATGTTGAADSTGTTDASGAAGAAAPVCDADTGICTDASGAATDSTTGTDTNLLATPAVIGGERAWGGPQLALIICALLGLLVLVGPVMVARRLSAQGAAPASGASPAAGAATVADQGPSEPTP